MTATDDARIALLRHGTTEWSAVGKHTGRTDIPLTADGEKQAQQAADRLTDFDFSLVLCSPLVRARATAELAGLRGVQIDPNLQEWDYGGYEGLTTAQIREQQPDWLLWRDGVAPGPDGSGESATAVGDRADEVIARIDPVLQNGDDVAIVSHGHFLRVLAARWLKLPANAGGYFALDTASISVLGFEHGERVIRHWNEIPDSRR